VKSELDIFSVPPTQTSVDHGCTVEYHPIAATLDAGPIEFNVPGTGDDYLDLANTYLHLSVKVQKNDKTQIANDAKVGPANLLLHTLFSQVDVSLNDKLVSSSSATYHYRAYLETLLNYGKAAKETQLTAAGWYKDTSGAMDDIDMITNVGLASRHRLASGSKTIDLVGRLHSDIFFQEKLLLSGVGMRIKLARNKDSMVLMANDATTFYRISIQKAVLRVRKVRVAPAVALSHAKALEHANAKYPINRVECKAFSISANSLDVTQENVFMGQIPSRVVVGLVDHDAFNGNFKKNLFNFKNYKLTKMSLQLDAQDQPVKPIYCNFDDNTFIEAYMSLFTGTGKAFKDEDIDVTRDDYANGYTLFCFDLTPDLGESDHYSLVKTGSVRLGMTFAEPLRTTVNVIVYAEFQNVLEIDRNRNVFYE
jgi:hypothetical protein